MLNLQKHQPSFLLERLRAADDLGRGSIIEGLRSMPLRGWVASTRAMHTDTRESSESERVRGSPSSMIHARRCLRMDTGSKTGVNPMTLRLRRRRLIYFLGRREEQPATAAIDSISWGHQARPVALRCEANFNKRSDELSTSLVYVRSSSFAWN